MRKSKITLGNTAASLDAAIKMFSQGQATPESLYVISHGIHVVLRDLVLSGKVSPHDEFLEAFLNLAVKDIVDTRTDIANVKTGRVMSNVSITNINSIIEATDEDDNKQRLVHGLHIGRVPKLSDEEYRALCELMLGYDDYLKQAVWEHAEE